MRNGKIVIYFRPAIYGKNARVAFQSGGYTIVPKMRNNPAIYGSKPLNPSGGAISAVYTVHSLTTDNDTMNSTQIELIDDARNDAKSARNELRATLASVRSLSPSVQRSLESACEKLHTAIEALNEVLN